MAKRQFDKMNDLARKFYARAGKEIEEGYDFSASNHGEELAMFAYAYDAFNYFDEDVRKHGIEMRKLKAENKALLESKVKMADHHLSIVDGMLKEYESLKEELRVTKADLEFEKDKSLEDL